MLILSGMCGHCCEHFFLSCVNTVNVRDWMFWVYGGGIAASYGHICGTSVAPLLRRCRPLLPFAPLKWTHCHKSRGRTVQPSLRFTKSVLSCAALYSKAFSSFHRARIVERLITTAKWAALVLTLGLAAATDVMQFPFLRQSLLVCHFVQKACSWLYVRGVLTQVFEALNTLPHVFRKQKDHSKNEIWWKVTVP